MNKKLLEPVVKRVRLLLGRGIVRLVNDAGGLQKMQLSLMGNEVRSNIERMQEYGYSSVPLDGAEAAVLFIGGARDHGIVVATDDRRYRIKSQKPGEVAIYTDEGDKIELKRNNQIKITTNQFVVDCEEFTVNASDNVTFYTPIVRANNDIVDRFITNADSNYTMRVTYNSHTHNENDSGGPTDPPNQQMDT